MTKTFSHLLLPAALLACAATAPGADVLTYHNDNFRTGLNAGETLLKPANVNVQHFGKLFAQTVDGQIYAQPLFMAGVAIAGKGAHNVVFVATQHDSVYAFDADGATGANAAPLWKRSLIPAGGAPVPAADTGSGDIAPEIGITSTPVIDAATGTLYCVARTKENGGYFQRLHALDIRSGAERAGSPVVLGASVAGTGEGNSGGQVPYDALRQNQRPALLLRGGVVYIASASHGDVGPYHGWVLGYDAATLAQVAAFNTTPDGAAGGIWQSGGGLAADEEGSVYFTTGNGSFNLDGANQHTGNNYGDAVMRLAANGSGALAFADFFTPKDEDARNQQDSDLGSSGVLLLPPIPGSAKKLALISGKPVDLHDGNGNASPIFLLDRENLGGFDIATNHVVQELTGQIRGLFATPAFFNNTVYLHGVIYGSGDVLKAYTFTAGGLLPATATKQADANLIYGFPGATPSISANGTEDGIVWEIQRVDGAPAVLHAYDASDISVELYNSKQAANDLDQPGGSVKFAVPTVARGKVYVGGAGQLTVYGLLDASKPPAVTIKAPTAATTGNDALTVGGAASGPNPITLVEVALDTLAGPGAFLPATGTTSWSLPVHLEAGPNTLRVRATDRAGGVSAEARRTITLVRFATLTVNLDGAGTVTAGFAPNSRRQIGARVTIVAMPQPGFAFQSWTGDIASAAASVSFQVTGGATLAAHFVATPFGAVTGSYGGILDSGTPATSGYITLTLGGTGSYSARAVVGGVSYSGRGLLNSDGDVTATLTHGRQTLALTLHLDIGMQRITGGLAGSMATLQLDRATFTAQNPSGVNGYYTLRIGRDAAQAASPQGFGYAAVNVDALGHVRAAGKLADGTRLGQGAVLSSAKVWPCFVPLSGGGGMFLGRVQVAATLTGTAAWFRPATTKLPLPARFASGFDAGVALAGALYNPKMTPSVLGIATGAAEFSAGDLGLAAGAAHSVGAAISPLNLVTFATDSYAPVLKIAPASGLVSGSFKHPVTGKVMPFVGVTMQGDTTSSAYFLDADQSGGVLLGP